MAAQFSRLKLRLLRNSFRRSPWQVVGMVIALVSGLGAGGLGVAALIGLRLTELPTATAIVVTAGSVIVLGFLLAPLAFGVDDRLDPRAFSLFGMSNLRVAAGLALSCLIGVPAVVITAVSLAQIVTWWRDPLAVGIAILSAVLIVATCMLGSRVTTSIAAYFLASRPAKETTALIALLVIVSLSALVAILARVDSAGSGIEALGRIASIIGWTPLGAAWAAPASAAAGDAGAALPQLAIALAFVVLLWFCWYGLVARMPVAQQRMSRDRARTGLGWFERLPPTPAAVIAARSITYWLRDPRYRASLAAIPVAPLVFVLVLGVAGVPWHVLALLPVPVMCLFLSWSVHNDAAYDSTAIWLHVASNTDGRHDRLGRVVPALIVGVPLVVVGSVVSAALYGDAAVLLSLIGVSSCILLAGLGLSSVVSARFPYPVAHPGDSPFAQPQASGRASGLIQSLSFIAALVIAIVPAGFAGLGLAFGMWGHLLSLVTGLAVGVAGLYVGVLIGGQLFSARAPELLEFSQRN